MGGIASVPGRGRRPKPTARKALAGNPGKRALNKDEPTFQPVLSVEPPAWMNEDATTMWQTIIGELCGQQVLCITDLHNVEAFCMAYARWREAERVVREEGITIEGAMGGKVKNPAVTVVNESLRQMQSFGALLGLDPSSRSRMIGAGKQKKEGNPFAGL